MLQEEKRAVVDAWQPRTEAAAVTERLRLVLDVLLLLLPLHSEGRIRQHVVESALLAIGVAVETVFREGVPEDDVVGFLALDQHVGLADRPGLIVPVLTEEVRIGFGVQVSDVLLGHREHAAGTTGRVVDRLDHVALAQVPLRREQEVDHQLDHLARGEVLSGLLVRLLGADPNDLLKGVSHLDVVHAVGRQIDRGELLDDLIEQVFLRHTGDLLIEGKPLHDFPDVLREAVDVGVKIRRKLVRIIEELGQIQLGEVVQWPPGDFLQQAADDGFRFRLDLRMLGKDAGLGRREQAVEAPQHRQWQDDLAVLVPLIWPAEQVADAPDEVGELGVGLGVQFGSSTSR